MNGKYGFGKYSNSERWSSYWHQINEVLSLRPGNVLVVGKGDGVVSDVLKKYIEKVKTMDINTELSPDIVGSIESAPIEDNSFDAVLCAEVLEHLPFEEFGGSLTELRRISGKNVIITLPRWGRHFSIEVRLPLLKKIRLQRKFSLFPIRHKFDGEHHWEIGKKGYPLKKIKKEIAAAGFKIINDYLCFESPYHHFFILEK